MSENMNENKTAVKENVEATPVAEEVEIINDDSDVPVDDPDVANEANEEETKLPPNFTYKDLVNMKNNAAMFVQICQNDFNNVASDYGVTTKELAAAVEYNTAARMSEEEFNAIDHGEKKYDHLNGIDNIPEEKIDEIFGPNAKIRGVDRTQTIDRIKSGISAFYNLYKAHSDLEYLQTELGKLMAMQEEESINVLRDKAVNGETEEIRQKAEEKVKEYEENKYLEFLPQKGFANLRRILSAFNNENKLNYLMERSRNYLKKLDVSEKFLLEIASFEKRFLPEKYHKQNNVLMILFMSVLVYDKVDYNTPGRRRTVGFVLALDNFIRNKLKDEERKRIYKNIIAFEDLIYDNMELRERQTKPASEE